ncbi:MAG TPA: hypothetical protein VH186_23550 [Chloroflexia bacterium]|nr:hypothetical protein [Chloroflexia bacterium]
MKKLAGNLLITIVLVLVFAFAGSVAFQTAAVFPIVILALIPFMMLAMIAYNRSQEEASGLHVAGPVNPWQPVAPPHYQPEQHVEAEEVDALRARLHSLQLQEQQVIEEIDSLEHPSASKS